MMTKQTQEALKMAIEAMERAEEVDWELNSLHVLNILQAITACKEALEQPSAQEPVAWLRLWVDGDLEVVPNTLKGAFPVYTTTAPTWQGLSDDEILEISPYLYLDDEDKELARAIEAKLKEKNNG